MAILALIKSVSVGKSPVGSHSEPSVALVDTVSIGRAPVGGHVVAEQALVNTISAGHAADDEMKDMTYLMVREI